VFRDRLKAISNRDSLANPDKFHLLLSGAKNVKIDRRMAAAFLLAAAAWPAWGQQTSLTWDQVKDRFEMNNPTLLAGKLSVEETRAQEITADLRPNPEFNLSVDGTQIAPSNGVWQPFVGTFESPGISFLQERRRKRPLRFESAKKATQIAEFGQADLERGLIFNLRQDFVQILQAKRVLDLAKANLEYYDKVLQVSRDQYQAGGIGKVDLDRLELQRVQYESDLQTADVNLRTSKIQLLQLLNEKTPVDQFDVAGTYDFNDQLQPLDDFRQMAQQNRPDLKAAVESVDKAQTDYKLAEANGSTDPTWSVWYTHNSSTNNPFAVNTIGVGVSIPLRIFDRNQGEKLRTKLDINRNQRLLEATQAQVFSDVDSGYATVASTLTLLRPYKAQYLDQAQSVRDTITFSYQHGGASLLDFLSAQSEYRSVELSYINLVGSYLTAASQLNMAVGREAIQ
jgi:cobalt-zinc-cadmium efflux system outer membrane protein